VVSEEEEFYPPDHHMHSSQQQSAAEPLAAEGAQAELDLTSPPPGGESRPQ
jgi:hypothetical protein